MYTSDCDGAPGSQTQVREGTNKLMNFAKSTGIPVIVIGHVTKEGAIAGPRLMEHLVDTVLYLEGERHYQFRVLRSMKNRFGSTNETGLFTMTEGGLEELVNPSALLLAERSAGQAGSTCCRRHGRYAAPYGRDSGPYVAFRFCRTQADCCRYGIYNR